MNKGTTLIVAEHYQETIGAIQAYSNIYHKIDDEMRSFIPGERLQEFEEFYDSRVENSLLINAMYVDEEFRRKGIANKLLAMVREEAGAMGFDKLSLFVLADNIPAQKLYLSNGFKTVKEIAFHDSEKLNFEGGFLLMACNI